MLMKLWYVAFVRLLVIEGPCVLRKSVTCSYTYVQANRCDVGTVTAALNNLHGSAA